jgi:hypothetical protein
MTLRLALLILMAALSPAGLSQEWQVTGSEGRTSLWRYATVTLQTPCAGSWYAKPWLALSCSDKDLSASIYTGVSLHRDADELATATLVFDGGLPITATSHTRRDAPNRFHFSAEQAGAVFRARTTLDGSFVAHCGRPFLVTFRLDGLEKALQTQAQRTCHF